MVPLEEYQLKNGWGVAVADCTRQLIAAERGSEIARDSRSEIDMLLYIHMHIYILYKYTFDTCIVWFCTYIFIHIRCTLDICVILKHAFV